MSNPSPSATDASRWERVFAFSSVALVALSLLAFAALILAPVWGITDYTSAPWPTILVFPLIALPIAILLFLAVVIGNWRRRSR